MLFDSVRAPPKKKDDLKESFLNELMGNFDQRDMSTNMSNSNFHQRDTGYAGRRNDNIHKRCK